MKCFDFFFFTLLFSVSSNAQNLISNPSFEEQSDCPKGDHEPELANGWIEVQSTVDYYSCDYLSDSLAGKDGNSYMGVSCYRPSWPNYREYIGRYLDQPLSANTEYYVEFWVKSENSKCTFTNSFGALFTNGIPEDNWTNNLLYTPQIENPADLQIDNINCWRRLSGVFTAQGGENFITLGSFKDDNSSVFTDIPGCNSTVHAAYVLFDAVLVTSDLSQVDTVYTDTNDCCPVTKVDPSGFNKCDVALANIITPNGDFINDTYTFTYDGHWELYVLNRWGQQVFFQETEDTEFWSGEDKNGKELAEGTYFIRFRDENKGCENYEHVTIIR